uniref:Uncharacterized protein n=1 Tax=Knipowitschia caucasica TaxID=637954 RepID=A0AAV2KEF7_KNICA
MEEEMQQLREQLAQLKADNERLLHNGASNPAGPSGASQASGVSTGQARSLGFHTPTTDRVLVMTRDQKCPLFNATVSSQAEAESIQGRLEEADLSALKEEERAGVRALLQKYRDVFAAHEGDLGCTSLCRVTPSLKIQLALWPGSLSPLPRAPQLQISQEGHPYRIAVSLLYLVGGRWSAWEKRFGFCREFGCSTIETLSCSWDKSGIQTGSLPPPTGRECVPFTGRFVPVLQALSTCGLYQGYHSERQPLFCPPLSRMSLETLERAHVWPPGSDHTATACTSAGVL